LHAPRTPAHVRAELVSALELDLIGPHPEHAYATEALPMAPSRWYLTGFLVPYEASEDQRSDPTSQEDLALGAGGDGADDDEPGEPASARRVYFPSSMGISVLVAPAEEQLRVIATWGDYEVTSAEEASGAQVPAGAPEPKLPHPNRETWRRNAKRAELSVSLDRGGQYSMPGSDGLALVVNVRRVPANRVDLVPEGTRAVSVFLVNHRTPSPDAKADESFAFQARLQVHSAAGFVSRPNLRGRDSKDLDEQIADLQYRSISEFAVGHGVATFARSVSGACHEVNTTWMPSAEVEKVVPGDVEGVELRMEALADADTSTVRALLSPLVDRYDAWLDERATTVIDHPERKKVAGELVHRARLVSKRIAKGIDLLTTDAAVLEAFRIANRAMAMQQRRRVQILKLRDEAPEWRPFQLAFILLNLESIADPRCLDRETVDLLFFPTGGGKTEAYLGLAAFTLVLRRLQNPGLSSAGVSVLMRYTLRLLTLDQLGRAAALISALELLRQDDVTKLGEWPFEIGLWVGQAATPNRMGKKGDGSSYTARAKTIAFKNDTKKPLPIPLESCPWCGERFDADSFKLVANGKVNVDLPTDLRVQCTNRDCDFSARRNRTLPIVAVDEPIYRRLPCFLIATVDKFAGLPWLGRAGALFGRVDHFDEEGFYGPSDEGIGRRLDAQFSERGGANRQRERSAELLPPDLIIQDELHLISGPLGTMAGLYETAIDALASRTIGGEVVRPKVVASTATVRRADKQIQALFARTLVDVFPPPGPDLRDSFFAKVVPVEVKNARLYCGVAAQGRSLKVALLRTYLALLAAAQRAYLEEGGKQNADNPADPYMSLLGYFSSLKELGGSRRIVEDEVRARLSGYGGRLRFQERRGLFADRRISFEVLELTSRESTAKVAEAKRRLGVRFAESEKERVDVALATNMISVGLDITRLGLMVVLGQPKTAAEYIQATSRVGRDDARPGLVVTIFNVHRPRDRSHFERFQAFHESFYRSVEATSVTPFSPRAIDRGLSGVVVGIARHGMSELTAPLRAVEARNVRTRLAFVTDALASRCVAHDPDRSSGAIESARAHLASRVESLLDDWARLAHENANVGTGLQYQSEEPGPPALLRDPLDPELASLPRHARRFKVHRSLRDVEPSVALFMRALDGSEVAAEEVEE
jgi:hypothetical protein